MEDDGFDWPEGDDSPVPEAAAEAGEDVEEEIELEQVKEEPVEPIRANVLKPSKFQDVRQKLDKKKVSNVATSPAAETPAGDAEEDDDLEAAALMAWSSSANIERSCPVKKEVPEPAAKTSTVGLVAKKAGASSAKLAAAVGQGGASGSKSKFAVPDFDIDEGFDFPDQDHPAKEAEEDDAPSGYVPTPIGAWKEEKRKALEKKQKEEEEAAAEAARKGKGKGKGIKRPVESRREGEPAAKKVTFSRQEVTDATKLPSGVGLKAIKLKEQGVKLNKLATVELSLAPPRMALIILQELVTRQAEGDQSDYVIKKLRAKAIQTGAWKPTTLETVQASKFVIPGPTHLPQVVGAVAQRSAFDREIATEPHAAPGVGKPPKPREKLDFDAALMQGRALSLNKTGTWSGSYAVDEATLASLLKIDPHTAIELMEELLAEGAKVKDPSIWLRTAVAQKILDGGRGFEMTKFQSRKMTAEGK